MRFWTLVAALGAMSMMTGCTVREVPPPAPPAVSPHQGRPGLEAPSERELPEASIRRRRRPRQRLAGL